MCMRTILTVPPPELEDRGSLLRLWGNGTDPPLADLELRVASLQLGSSLPRLGPGRPAALHLRGQDSPGLYWTVPCSHRRPPGDEGEASVSAFNTGGWRGL